MKQLHNNVRYFEVDGISMLGNFHNGAIIGLDSSGKEYIQCRSHSNEPLDEKAHEIEAALDNLGFLDDLGNENLLDAAYLHVTDRCNLHCVGCYSYVDERNCRTDLPIEKLFYVLDQLRNTGTRRIIISGGEPFLRHDLKDICRYAREVCNVDFLTVITNGCISKDSYLPVLPYINELNISVDGYSESTRFIRDNGIMPMVLETIRKLKSLVPINLIFTLHRKNMNYMPYYTELAKSLNVSHSYSMLTVSPDNTLFHEFLFSEDDLAVIADNILNKNGVANFHDVPINQVGLSCRDRCEAGCKLVSIAANGDVYPCHMLHMPELKLGNLADMKSLLKEIVFSSENPFLSLNCSKVNVCNECSYKDLCGAGCRSRSYLYHRNLLSPDSYCRFIKTYYMNVVSGIKEKLCRES